MYWDEYFAPATGSTPPDYLPAPNQPEYLYLYQSGSPLVPSNLPTAPISPSSALGFLFADRPGTYPGATDSFVTALVGVNGTCNQLISSDCISQIIPQTTFQWSSVDGGISQNTLQKYPAFPIVNPVDLTAVQLSVSLISVNQFLQLASLTPSSLAAMGGGIANISGKLIPSQAMLLCDFNQDGYVTVSEVQLLINEALGLRPAANDLTGDRVVNIANIQIEIAAALGAGCSAW